ncbi:hypothetical protein SALBM135S_01372 [Streptomyces alboniger]
MTSKLMHRESSSVGSLLREWRNRRGVSQLELASRAGCSTRHISFIETGRARPSMDVLLRFAADLDLPLRDRNVLLVAAGYAPYFQESSMDGPAPGVVRGRLRRLVAAHEPHPVLVFDAQYRHIVEANRHARRRRPHPGRRSRGAAALQRRAPAGPRGHGLRRRPRSWYTTGEGRVVNNWSSSIEAYRERTAVFAPQDYVE